MFFKHHKYDTQKHYHQISLTAFLERTHSEVQENGIPPDLIINWDQTDSKLVPVGEWTMAGERSKQVPVVGKEDKQEITVLLVISASRVLLPPQIIYKEKRQDAMLR